MERVWEGEGHVNIGGGNRAYSLSLPLPQFVCLKAKNWYVMEPESEQSLSRQAALCRIC